MEKILFTITFLSILTELFLIGTVMGFFQKKIVAIDFFKFLMPAAFIVFALFLGILLANKLKTLFGNYTVWYASTILFILSFKLMYDGIKLDKIKKTINPLDAKGLIYLSILVSLNALFIGTAFGLLKLEYSTIAFSSVSAYLIMVAGYFRGFTLKKLISFRNDLFFAAVFMIVAIFIAIKF